MKMKDSRRQSKILLLVILILVISIGFAMLSTTLKIDGNTIIKKNTWSVYWDSIGDIEKSTKTVINSAAEVNESDNTKLSFSVTLDQPGDYYEFQVDAVNAGSIDAMVNVVSTLINDDEDEDLPPYIHFDVTYADGAEVRQYHLLEKADDSTTPATPTRERYKVRLEYDRDITNEQFLTIPSTGLTYTIDMNIPYDQADDNAFDRNTVVAAAFRTDDWSVIATEGNRAAQQTSVTDNVCGAYHVGDTREIDMGTLGTHTVRIANCSTPEVCSTNGFSETSCGFVIEFADAVGTLNMNPYAYTQYVSEPGHFNTGGWKYSEIRAYINSGKYLEGTAEEQDFTSGGIYNNLPTDLKNAIKKTNVISGYGVRDAENGNFETQDKLFLLAIHEVYLDSGSGSMKNNAKDWDYTRQLDYYTGSDSGNYGDVNHDGNYLTAKKNGENNVAWWTRTANSNYYWYFYVVASGGGWRNTESYDTANGVSPAFKLK